MSNLLKIIALLHLSFISLHASAETNVILLGTGNPNPFPDRSGPATAIVTDGRAYIFDAGTGTVRRAAEASVKHNIPALQAKNLSHVFLTHLHSDHTLGLSDLILTPWGLEREQPLQLFGPAGTGKMASNILAAYKTQQGGALIQQSGEMKRKNLVMTRSASKLFLFVMAYGKMLMVIAFKQRIA